MDDGVIVLVSDIQAGGSTAIMASTIIDEDKQPHKPTRWQSWLHGCWQDACQVVKGYSKNDPVFVICNGDMIEGTHHHTTQLVTHDKNIQVAMAVELLDELLQHATGCAFTRGTTAHVGHMAEYEKVIAEHFENRGLVKDGTSFVHSVFKRTIFGMRINAAHHVSGGRTARLRQSALGMAVERHVVRCQKANVPCADYFIRAHTHFFTDTQDLYGTRGIVSPSWQMPTDFVNQIAADELADIGMVIIRHGDVIPLRYKILKEDRRYPVLKINGNKKI